MTIFFAVFGEEKEKCQPKNSMRLAGIEGVQKKTLTSVRCHRTCCICRCRRIADTCLFRYRRNSVSAGLYHRDSEHSLSHSICYIVQNRRSAAAYSQSFRHIHGIFRRRNTGCILLPGYCCCYYCSYYRCYSCCLQERRADPICRIRCCWTLL